MDEPKKRVTRLDAETDILHCKAIRHEYMRCYDAFELFASIGTDMVMEGHTNLKGYRAYNAYSNFILHLYELYLALFARDLNVPSVSDSSQIKRKVKRENKKRKKAGKDPIGVNYFTDPMINEEVRRQAQARLDDIDRGAAPSWENDRALYEGLLPPDPNFAKEFRELRNKIAGHVTYERIQDIKLTEFFHKYHFYLYLLYETAGSWWGRHLDKPPEFGEVTDFLKAISKKRPDGGQDPSNA